MKTGEKERLVEDGSSASDSSLEFRDSIFLWQCQGEISVFQSFTKIYLDSIKTNN